jgi:hypothetical protein
VKIWACYRIIELNVICDMWIFGICEKVSEESGDVVWNGMRMAWGLRRDPDHLGLKVGVDPRWGIIQRYVILPLGVKQWYLVTGY